MVKLSKQLLEKLYAKMSISEMAIHLGMSRSTLYYQMKKLGVSRRNRSEAQSEHVKRDGHQRSGTKHDDETKLQISKSSREYWDSDGGMSQRKKLSNYQKEAWQKRSQKEKHQVISRLQTATRPSPGELSRFGTALAAFLVEAGFNLTTGKALTADHISDIVLVDKKVVIELVISAAVYGDEAGLKLDERYERITHDLKSLGYRVVIVRDISNSISRARCERIHERLLSFFQQKRNHLIIES